MPTNTNAGESKHKEAKKHAGSASGRDNLVHIWRTNNDGQALKALTDGLRWDARGWDGRRWVEKRVEAGTVCREALDAVFKLIPMAPTCGHGDDPSVTKPHGYVQWEVGLAGQVLSGATSDSLAWQEVVSATVPDAAVLESRYDDTLGCGRTAETPPCTSPSCSFCWRSRGRGLIHRTVTCFNHWAAAPVQASAGAGVIRGGAVKSAHTSPTTWALSSSSRGSDVEIYVTADARRNKTRGLRHTTLGKVAYFFEHQGNDLRRVGEEEMVREGVWTVWVAVLEYVTAGRRHTRKVDSATGCDVFSLRNTLSFYPASFIRRVVHMVHQCNSRGTSSCGLVRGGEKVAQWRCRVERGDTYLLNRYFHALGRDPVIT